MKNKKDLVYLLALGIQDLYSAEEQILEALPKMVKKATDAFLKTALQEHLSVTREQVKRLEEVKRLLVEQSGKLASADHQEALPPFFSGSGKQPNNGIRGLIEESERFMKEDFMDQVMDAAIIGCAQKIEHYEIAGYGTARALAHELDLGGIAALLETTLSEEHEADERLSNIALGGLNEAAEAEGVGDEDWMNTGRPTSAESGGVTPAAAKKNVSNGKRSSAKSPAGKEKRPSARKVQSPGGRAGTSHRERPGH